MRLFAAELSYRLAITRERGQVLQSRGRASIQDVTLPARATRRVLAHWWSGSGLAITHEHPELHGWMRSGLASRKVVTAGPSTQDLARLCMVMLGAERSCSAVSGPRRIRAAVLRHLDRRPAASVCERLVVEARDHVQVRVQRGLPLL